jgi:hypothetical protein
MRALGHIDLRSVRVSSAGDCFTTGTCSRKWDLKFWRVFYIRIIGFMNFVNRLEFEILGNRRMPSSGMLRCVVVVRTHVSVELSASFIRVTRNTCYFFAECVGC